MKGNPEFRRNLWVQFEGTRVLVGGLLAGLVVVSALAIDIALAQGSRFAPTVTHFTAYYLALTLILFWAGRQAAGAVLREIRNRTWDSQRLSTLHPWRMAWGKLFGATSLAWTLTLICLAVYAGAALVLDRRTPAAILATVAEVIGYGLFCQATGLLASLARVSGRPGERAGSTTVAQVAGLVATGILAAYVFWGLADEGRWFGIDIGPEALRLATIWHFALWSVVGVYRRMRRELQMRSAPWAWLLFLAAITLYVAGLAHGRGDALLALVLPTAVLMLMMWVINFIEAKDAMQLRQCGQALRRGNLAEAATLLPLWVVTYAAFAAVAGVSAALAFAGDVRAVSLLPRALPSSQPADAALMLIAALLFVTRDVFIVQTLALGREPHLAGAYGLMFSFVFYFAIPAVIVAAQQWRWIGIALPTGQGGWALCVGPAAIQALFCLGLFVWRWRAYWRANAIAAR